MCSEAVFRLLLMMPLTSQKDPHNGKVRHSLPKSLGYNTAAILQGNMEDVSLYFTVI